MSAGYVLAFVSAHSAILGFLLRLRRNSRPGDGKLGDFLIVLSLLLVFCSFDFHPVLARIPALDIGYLVSINALAPAFYSFILEKSGRKPEEARWKAPRFALSAIALFLGLASLPWLLGPPSPALIASPPLPLRAVQLFADLELYRFQAAAYLVASFLALRSSPPPRGVAFAALAFLSIAWAIDQAAALFVLVGPGADASAKAAAGSWVLGGVVLLAFGLGYLALFEGRPGARPLGAASLDPAQEAELRAAFAKASAYMERERPWLDPGLSVEGLSRDLGMPPRELSRAINSSLGLGFKAYINRRRIEEAKLLLLSRPGDSILDIALESGFNSKSAFNRVFKELCGETPSEFKSPRR